MKPIAKILIPVDLSLRSIEAARYAESLGSEFGSELVFIHALQEGWPLGAEQRNVREGILSPSGCTRRLPIREGSPVSVIVKAAETERVALVLMATRPKPALSLRGAGFILRRDPARLFGAPTRR